MSEERDRLLRSLERHALYFRAEEKSEGVLAAERLLSAARALGDYDAVIHGKETPPPDPVKRPVRDSQYWAARALAAEARVRSLQGQLDERITLRDHTP